jgi:hypothetical protein
MVERQRKGSLNLDPAVVKWQSTAAENQAALTDKQKRDRARTRIYIDVDAGLKEVIEKIADIDHEDTSMSQAAEMLLAYGAVVYFEGQELLHEAFRVSRVPARTPRFAWHVSLPCAWQRFLDHYRNSGQVDGQKGG